MRSKDIPLSRIARFLWGWFARNKKDVVQINETPSLSKLTFLRSYYLSKVSGVDVHERQRIGGVVVIELCDCLLLHVV